MTTATRTLILDVILDAADAMGPTADRSEAIRRAVREFCGAFPREADEYATALARDYATRDQNSPPSPYPPQRPPTVDVDAWPEVPF